MRTRIDNGTVIAWCDDRHVVLDTGVVVFSGTEIEFVGERFDGPADRSIDATGRLVIPGLVNAHLHVTDTPYTKGFLEEIGASRAGMAQNFAALYRILPAVRAATDADSQVAAAACAFADLARTDTYPFDMFNEMRMASVICKVAERNALAGLTRDVFHMATVGGADALGRPDLGRLAAGCKADIVFVRIDTPKAAPVYDPFKFLVHAASGDDVERVIVDGTTVVENGEVLTIDVPEVVRRVNEASGRVRAKLDL